MSATAEISDSAGSSSAVKARKDNRLWLITAAFLLIAANASFWFYRVKAQERAAQLRLATSVLEQVAPESIALEPFVVNLAGGEGYLKVALTIAVKRVASTNNTAPASAEQTLKSAAVRDTILSTLSAQDAGALLTTDGKAAVKEALKSALEAKAPMLSVSDIYFTEFLIER